MTAHLPIRPSTAPPDDPGVDALALAGSEAGLSAFLVVVQALTRADHVCLISDSAPDTTSGTTLGTVKIVRATSTGVEGLCFKTPAPLTGAPKRLADLAKTFGWAGALPTSLSAMHSLLAVPFASPDGRAGAILCLAKRIQAFSPRHCAHLTQLAARARRILPAAGTCSNLGVGVVDLRGKEAALLHANTGLAAMLDQDTVSLTGTNLRSLVTQNTPEAARLAAIKTLQERMEMRCQLRKGASAGPWATLTLVPMQGPSLVSEIAVLLVDDRTKRGAEPEMSGLDATLEGARDAIVVLDACGRIVFANRATQSLLAAGGLAWSKGALFADTWQAVLTKMGTGLPRKALRRPPLHRICAYPAGVTVTLPDAQRLHLRATPLAQGGILLIATKAR